MKLLKSRLEGQLREAAAENGEAMNSTAGGLMIASYELDHLHDPEI